MPYDKELADIFGQMGFDTSRHDNDRKQKTIKDGNKPDLEPAQPLHFDGVKLPRAELNEQEARLFLEEVLNTPDSGLSIFLNEQNRWVKLGLKEYFNQVMDEAIKAIKKELKKKKYPPENFNINIETTTSKTKGETEVQKKINLLTALEKLLK